MIFICDKWLKSKVVFALRIEFLVQKSHLQIDIDNEFLFLQIRRIVELITFSSIVADEFRYQRLRQIDAASNNKDKGDYTADWNASEILVKLSKISPHSLPRPLSSLTVMSDGTKHFSESTAKLAHDRLISIYKTAGGYLHSANPYKENVIELEQQKKISARALIIKELKFLKSVIWEHAKIGLNWKVDADPTELDNPNTAWIISFGDSGTNEVKMLLATAI